MIIALASPKVSATLAEGLDSVHRLMSVAASQGAAIVCFPEAYLPGLRGLDFEVPDFNERDQVRCLETVSQWARVLGLGAILGMERVTKGGRQIASFVIDRGGELLGHQVKTQLDPSEDRNYIPGDSRQLFEIDGVKFGIAICHEGWRYPETVRWAARRGAKIVFHPQHSGSDGQGVRLTEWGSAAAPYYEKAMRCRSIENTIWFASVNYCLQFQESATTLINPSGECEAFLPYGTEGVLVRDIDPGMATGLIAKRYAPERYPA